ncbi:MAG: PQQ-dependent sugar dehydrogenase, partial [Longimicrobiales bacterium]
MTSRLVVLVVIAACAEGGVTVPNGNVDGTEVDLELVTDELNSPVHLTAPSGDNRLFIVEQEGTIRIVRDGALLPDPFLDIRERVLDGGEQGLLSMAF